MGNKLDKFLLLMWKNWLLQWRHPVQTLVEIVAPVLFSALLVLIRSLVDPEEYEAVSYPPYNPLEELAKHSASRSITASMTEIGYSPTNPQLESIMQDAASQLGIPEVKSWNSSEGMMFYFTSSLTTLAGIQFSDSLLGDVPLTRDLRAAIRFPGELRRDALSNFIPNTWKTNWIFPLYQIAGPREHRNMFTADPWYYEEGFIGVQMAVTNAVIRHFGGQPPEISLQRFPYPGWINDPLLTALQSFVGIIIMLSFVYSCISTVKVITTEKEKQLKEAMKIMGLPNWLHWVAWFLKTFSFLLISVILIVVLLKVSWYPGTTFSVFTLANPFVIFVFLICYMCATITFCFMISVFFSKANTAAAIAGLAWFMSYAPYLFLQQQYANLTLATKIATSLASNTAMAFGFQIILMFEGTGDGVQWHNIFRSASTDDTLTLGYIMLMLLLDALIYLLIALYIEAIFPGTYGVPQVWYFPFTSAFWCGQPRYTGVEDFNSHPETNEFFEKEPENLPAGIQIKHLRKVFAKKAAVRDLSLNMYENQITVLLGHNGAGKTTTMSMLTGMFPPTSGTALVSGFNIRTDMDKVRESLGLCPQHNVLFDELTVREHLYFFSKLKGLTGTEIESEIIKYIELLELVPKENAKSVTLSGGMKRKLSVGVALCGNSKVVMLDEPTAGMDPSARRALWDLLQKQKTGRTLLLTTHFMDEADLLGDRIAIMAGGQLQCCGSSFFLKKKYGAGYHLIMEKSARCDPVNVTRLLQRYIPDLEIENNIGSELSYCLNEEKCAIFESMLSDLEVNSASLGVESYGISLTTLEEVFMKVGADHGQEEIMNQSEQNGNAAKHQTYDHNPNNFGDNHLGKHYSESKLNIGDSLLTGFALRKNQVFAMFLKKFLSIFRTLNMLIIQLLLPVLFLIIAIIVTRAYDTTQDLPELTLTLDSYDNPITVVSGSNRYKDAYLSFLSQSNNLYTDWKDQDLSDNIIAMTKADVATVRNRYIVATSFHEDESMTVLYNNQPYHSPPLAVSLALNSVAKTQLGSNFSVEFTNFPFPFTISFQVGQLDQGNNVGFNLAFNIGFSMAFVASFYVLFYVRERVVKSKHLQFVSGVNFYIFWITSYLCDIITFVMTAIGLVITLAAFQEEGFSSVDDLSRIFLLLLCFGYCALPVQFLASFCFDVPSTGFVRMTLFNIFTGVAAFLTIQVLATQGLNLEHIADTLDWVFLVLPHYCLSTGINNMYNKYSTYSLCETLVVMCTEQSPLNTEQCWSAICSVEQLSVCCDVNTNYFEWEKPGIGRNLLFSLITGTVLFILLLIIESGVFKNLMYFFRRTSTVPPTDDANEDSDVLEEKGKIRAATKAELEQYTLVLKDVTKYYKNFLAVNQLCLGVKRHECFGLLGINGAGKTTTFKMMTGDVPISHGDASVNGMSLKSNINEVHKLIGYCPQFDALLDDLTGSETMIMFGLLRGIPYAECKYIAESLAKEFDFHRHLHKQVKEYSGGSKRKLSTAVALIGDPPVVYLDEPTTGMDPATKRYLWNALCRVRDSGKCIVLTSHSMEECEALCTRLAIMVNGTFRCLGSTQRLKSKFSEGYTLTVKTKKVSDGEVDLEGTEAIERFVKEKYPEAVLGEKHQELLTYRIMNTSHSWAKMFGIMEAAKKNLNIEDYSIGQSSLEQVFLMFTKMQRVES